MVKWVPIEASTVRRYLTRALSAVGGVGGVAGGAAQVAGALLNNAQPAEDVILRELLKGPASVGDLVPIVGSAATVPPAIENLHKLRLVATEEVDGDLRVALTAQGRKVAAALKA
ncbi:MAG: hypothetical protein AB7O88_02540 [Reyranellaceae bacterium]